MNILKLALWKATKLKQPMNWKDFGEKMWNTLQDCLNQRTAVKIYDLKNYRSSV